MDEQQPEPKAIYQNGTKHLRKICGFGHIENAPAEIRRTWLDVIQAGIVDGSFGADVPRAVLYRTIRDAVWLSTP